MLGRGRGAAPGCGELELSFASGSAAAELPPLPPAPLLTFEVFSASEQDMRPGQFPGKGRALRLSHLPEGVWHLRPLSAVLAGFSPAWNCRQQLGTAEHSWPSPTRQRPTLKAARRGPPAAPHPLLPLALPCQQRGLQWNRVLQPLAGLRLPVGISPSGRIQVLSTY